MQPDRAIVTSVTQAMRKLLERVESWPQEDQEELVEYAREIEARRSGVYHQVARGEIATKEEIEAAFAKFRRA
jgi:hypothetical protein